MSFVPPPIPAGALEALSRELGETASGTQITRLLAQARLPEGTSESTKWKRIYYTIDRYQRSKGDGRALVAVLHAFMDPGRFSARPDDFDQHRSALNISLAPAIRSVTEFPEVLDLLTLVSMLHRRLDAAELTPAAPAHPHHVPSPSQ